MLQEAIKNGVELETERWQARVDLAAAHRLCVMQDFHEGIFNHLTYRVPGTNDRYYQIPFGLHWSWNWAQASLLGLPVSGLTRIAPAPLLHAINAGPNWLTGGAYGIEGGAACSIALIISILVVWRTKLIARADVTEPRAGRGPYAGSPRGVVDATGL